MKQLLLACLLGVAAMGANAAPALSCDEVNQVGEALTELGIALDDENAEIGEGTPQDQALAETVVAIADIAAAEDDQELADGASEMADSWDAMDRERFVEALAYVVGKFAVIASTECP